MPTHFGPAPGPRQGEEGNVLFSAERPETTMVSVTVEAERAQLAEMLPPCFEVGQDSFLTLLFCYMTDIPWLAGRGYNTLGVTIPAVFKGRHDTARGDFLLVLWENLADPIISGREELGFAKVYCELPPPTIEKGRMSCTASWLGFTFLDLHIAHARPAGKEDIEALGAGKSEGLLHYKYIPATQDWGEADAAYAVFTPAFDPYRRVVEIQAAEGSFEFHKASWQDLPTLYHVVNAFYDLRTAKVGKATIIKTRGAKDLRDQRILR